MNFRKYVQSVMITVVLITLSINAGGAMSNGKANLRVATIHSSFQRGNFHNDWHSVLKKMNCQFDEYENINITDLAKKLKTYDIVLTGTVFNHVNTQDFSKVKVDFLNFLHNGGILIVADANYTQTLKNGICRLSADFKISSELTSTYKNYSHDSRKVIIGPYPDLAKIPNNLIPLYKKTKQWAHLKDASDKWRAALIDGDGNPTLVYQQVGKGMIVLSNFDHIRNLVVEPFGIALLENVIAFACRFSSGLEIENYSWGDMQLGKNICSMTFKNLNQQKLTLVAKISVNKGNGEIEQKKLTITIPPGKKSSFELAYYLNSRGKQNLKFICSTSNTSKPLILLSKAINLAPLLNLSAKKRNYYMYEQKAVIKLIVSPARSFDPKQSRLVVTVMDEQLEKNKFLLKPLSQSLSIPLNNYKPGKYLIKAAIVNKDKSLAMASLPISIHPKPYVRIMPNLSCSVNNKPFFPIATYIVAGSKVNTSKVVTLLRECAKTGFNTVHINITGKKRYLAVLDEAQKLGLMIIPEHPYALKTVDQYKHRKQILSWVPTDEPDTHGISVEQIQKTVSDLRSKDYSRPIQMLVKNHNYFDFVDILLTTRYIIEKRFIKMNVLSERYIERQKEIKNKKPIWPVVQSFGGYARFNIPTPAEERNMTYQYLVQGAKAIWYYAFKDGKFTMTQHPKLHGMMKQLCNEIKVLSPILLANTPGKKLILGKDKNCYALLKSYNNKHYLLIVNASRKNQGVINVPLPEYYTKNMNGLFGEKSIQIVKGLVKIDLPPLAVKVYEN